MEIPAESAYLFRHAIVREAAYQLSLPSARAELHRAAVSAFEARGTEFANQFAAELANHARLAGDTDAEVRYLPIAALAAKEEYQNESAARLLRRLCLLVPQGEEAHIKALVSLAETLDFQSDNEPAIAACKEALRLAGQAGLMALHVRAATLLPQILRSADRYEEARQVIEEHSESVEIHGNRLSRTRQVMTLAAILQQTGHIEQAIESSQQAVELAGAEGSTELAASALSNYAFQLIYASRPAEAEPLLLDAVETLRKCGRRHMAVQAWMGLATLYMYLGQPDKAETSLRDVLVEARAIGQRRCEENTLSNLGVTLYEQGRADEALECYLAAMALARESDSRATEAHLLANMTSLYNSIQRYEKAAEAASCGLAIAREIGNVPHAMMLQMNLSRALLFQGRLAAAEACLRDGIETSAASGIALEHGAMLAFLANLLLLTGREDEAARCLQLADESPAFNTDRLRWLRYAYTVRCHLMMARGEASRVREALANEADRVGGMEQLQDNFDEVLAQLDALEEALRRGDEAVMWQGYQISMLSPGLRRAIAEYTVHTEEGRQRAARHPRAAAELARQSASTPAPDWRNPDWQGLHTPGSFGMQRD